MQDATFTELRNHAKDYFDAVEGGDTSASSAMANHCQNCADPFRDSIAKKIIGSIDGQGLVAEPRNPARSDRIGVKVFRQHEKPD